jgi:hypothetical protein
MPRTLLLTHPLTGSPIAPVGYRKDGRAIWPILGGSEDAGGDGGDGGEDAAFVALGGQVVGDDTDSDSGDDVDTEDGNDADDDASEDLGDKGKQAIDRMKAKLKAERTRRIAAEKAAAAKADSDDADKIRREADEAATAKANARIVRSEIRAAATGKLADPADALAFLDVSDFEVDDDGAVDEDEIAEAIADLLTKKPHLAAQGGTKAPKPDRSQGARGKGAASTAQQFADAIPL